MGGERRLGYFIAYLKLLNIYANEVWTERDRDGTETDTCIIVEEAQSSKRSERISEMTKKVVIKDRAGTL